MTGSFDTSSLPLVLAGPILRRVDPPSPKSSDGADSASDSADPASVTVWVALSEALTVSLTVFEDDDPLLTSDTEDPVETVQLGENLHVVAVTADTRVDEADKLTPGTVYSYDLEFKGDTTKSLADSNVLERGIESITYGDQPRPTFSLPPPDLDDLRIVHTSCRKPHDPLPDAFPAVHEMIHWTATDANARPHQLFLTGDQIYADDIADALLAHIDYVAPGLFGPTESFPTSDGEEKKLADMPPGSRDTIADEGCGFTSGHKRSHLFGIGEYYVMYLLNWSEVLWPDNLPTPKEVLPDEYATAMRYIDELRPEADFNDVRGWVEDWGLLHDIREELFKTAVHEDYELFSDAVNDLKKCAEDRDRLHSFENTLANVRKALANVPTYMIFDDHDITDDWFLRGKWTKRVVDKDMGRQVLQNAMAAYAVYQGWGNAPERFESGTGRELLDKLEIEASDDDEETEPVIDRSDLDELLGIPTVSTSGDESELKWPRDPIDWHYTVQGTSDGERTAHEVLVLDTRTRRGFSEDDEPPEILRTNAEFSEDDEPSEISRTNAFESQIPEKTTNAEVTVVVSAVPVWVVPFVSSFKESTVARLMKEYPERDPEHWHLQHQAQERLVARLATRASDSDEMSRSRVVLLSGDVHHSYSSRIQYWAERPFEAEDAERTELVVASLTASGAKNTSPRMWSFSVGGMLHNLGYQAGYILGLLVAYPLAKFIEGMPEEIVFGWNEEPPQFPDIIRSGTGGQQSVPPFRYSTESDPPLAKSPGEIGDEYELGSAPEPDWRYRVDFLDAETYAGDGSDAPSPNGDLPPVDGIVIPQHGESGTDTRRTALGEYLEYADWWSNATYHESAGPSDRGGEWGFGSEIVGVNSVGEVAFEWGQEETGETEGKRVIHALWWRLDRESGALPPFPLSKYVVSLDYDDDDHPRPKVIADS